MITDHYGNLFTLIDPLLLKPGFLCNGSIHRQIPNCCVMVAMSCGEKNTKAILAKVFGRYDGLVKDL